MELIEWKQKMKYHLKKDINRSSVEKQRITSNAPLSKSETLSRNRLVRDRSFENQASPIEIPLDIWRMIHELNPTSLLLQVCNPLAQIVRKSKKGIRFTKALPNDKNSKDFIINTIRGHPCLRRIDFFNCGPNLNHSTLTSITNSRTKFPSELEFVSMKNCKFITDKALRSFLFRLKKLKALDLRGCSKLTHCSLSEVNFRKRLQCLALGTDRDSQNISPNNETLKQIIGGNSHPEERIPSLRNEKEQMTLNNQSRNDRSGLVLLFLTNTRINNFNPIRHISETLRYLNLSGSKFLNDNTSGFLKDMTYLLELNISGCPISDETFISVSFCKSLEFLDASNTLLKADSLTMLSEYLLRLKYLIVQGCRAIDDESLRNVLIRCQRLRALDISGCVRITRNFPISDSVFLAVRTPRLFRIADCAFDKNDLSLALLKNAAFSVNFQIASDLTSFRFEDFFNYYKKVDTLWSKYMN